MTKSQDYFKALVAEMVKEREQEQAAQRNDQILLELENSIDDYSTDGCDCPYCECKNG